MSDHMRDITWAACLTPAGAAAIASIALRGPQAWHIARALFQPRAPLPADPSVGQFWLGRFGTGIADEVVLAVKQVDPVLALEIHCHGGREAVRLVLELLEARGARVCTWQELVRLHAISDLRAQAEIELVRASTVRTAAILLDQYHGAFERALDELRAALTSDCERAKMLLGELAGRVALGRHLTAPWRVAVLGAPNVGKSSLVNALAGYQRSVVSPLPGTTRDVVTTSIAVEGWAVELSDTAGLRNDASGLEAAGMTRAQAASADADLCLWVLDASAAPSFPRPDAAATLRIVINKIDLPAAWDLERAGAAIRVSARTGTGIPELCQALGSWLVPQPPPPGAAVPFTASWCDRVEGAWRNLQAGKIDEARRALDI